MVFTNASSSKNPGDGRPDDGDIIGWINRGLDYRDIRDTAGEYAVTLTATGPEISYPLTADITLRRLQQFKVQPGDKLTVRVGDAPASSVTVPADGLVTIVGVSIPSADGVRVTISR